MQHCCQHKCCEGYGLHGDALSGQSSGSQPLTSVILDISTDIQNFSSKYSSNFRYSCVCECVGACGVRVCVGGGVCMCARMSAC